MATLSKDKIGFYVRFTAPGDRRRNVRLTGLDRTAAEAAKHHIEVLIRAARRSQPAPLSSIDYAARHAPVNLQVALADARLIEDRRLLGDACDAFVMAQAKAKKVTQGRMEDFQRVIDSLVAFLGPRVEVAAIAGVALDEWCESLDLASNTIAKYCQIAQQVFHWFEAEKLIETSPAAELPTSTHAAEQRVTVAASDVTALMSASDPELARALAFARWGGMRFGEIMRADSRHIDWREKSIEVIDTKRDKPRRCPLFLEIAQQIPRSLTGPLFPSLRSLSSRGVGHRLDVVAQRCGVRLWPRLWHNMRATRETELIADFGIVDACLWIGNSPAIAQKHYAMGREEVFRKAVA